ncbi:hypothetical protein EC988_008090, partial [Linderina pennispora]
RGRGIGSLLDILDFLTEGTTVPAKHIQNNQRGGGYGALFDILGYLAEGTTIPARRVQTNQRGGYEDDYDYEDTYNQRSGINKRSPAAFVAPSEDWLRRNPSLARKYRNHEIMF